MRNLGSGLFLFLARAAAVLLQLRIVAQHFGPAYSGLNVLLNQVTYYALIAEFGLSAAGLSLLFAPAHRGEQERVAALLAAMQEAVLRTLRIAVPCAVLVLGLFALRLEHELRYTVALFALLCAAGSSFLLLASLPSQCLLNATGRLWEVNFVLGAGFLLQTSLALLLAHAGANYIAVAAIFPAIAAGETLILRRRGKIADVQPGPEALLCAARDLRGKAKYVLLHRIGGLIYYQSDYLVLSLAASLATVGAYAEYQYLAAGAVGLFTALGNAALTTIARTRIDSSPAQTLMRYGITSKVALFSSLSAALLFFALAPDCVHLLFHADTHASKLPFLLGVLLLLNLAKCGDDLWISAAGAFEIGWTFPLFEAGMYLIVGVILARKDGAVGIVFAGIATNLIFSGALRSFVLARGVLHTGVRAATLLRAKALLQASILNVPLGLVLLLVRGIRQPGLHASTAALAATIYLLPAGWLLLRGSRLYPNGFLATSAITAEAL